jgi:hypothetical protein
MGIWVLVSPPMERFRTWRVGLSWVLGASLIVLPWLARNVMVFGQIQPYTLPPSTVSGWWNLRIFISAQIAEVLGSPYLGTLVGWSVPGLLTLLLMIVVNVRLSSQYWSILLSEERRALLFSLIYALLEQPSS